MSSPSNPNLAPNLPPQGPRRIVYLEANRAPTVLDTKYRDGSYYEFNTEWRDKSTTPPNIYKLAAIVSKTNATWLLVTGGSGVMVQFTVPLGSTPVLPTGAGNITLTSSEGTIDITGGSHTINFDVQATLRGTGTTVNAVTADIITFPLGSSAGTYTWEARIAGFESTTPAGTGYQIFGVMRTDGASGTLIGVPDKVLNEEAALAGSDANLIVSGNNAIWRVTGKAGLTIHWAVTAAYTFKDAT